MKKIVFLLMVFSLLSINLFAKRIDIEQAKIVASNYLNRCAKSNSLQSAGKLNSVESFRKKENQNYYVFNGNNCFIIVSASDKTNPILAYSFENSLDVRNIPDGMNWLLSQYSKEIEVMESDSAKFVADANVIQKWQSLFNEKENNALDSYLLGTALITSHWYQSGAYSEACPAGTYVGCVATAMSQIIRYWGKNKGLAPTHGYGTHSYYLNNYGTLTVDYANAYYDYANMPDKCYSYSPAVQRAAVAKLCYHCGVSVDMNYGTDASSAYTMDAVFAFAENFGYTKAKYVTKSSYTADSWFALMKNEIDNERPVIYRGSDTAGNGGHAWICDGYDAQNRLHVNWGWGGADGFFYPSAMSPNISPKYYFNNGQAAIIHIYPTNCLAGTHEIKDTICSGSSYSFGGKTLTTSGTYRDTLQTDAGCDSIIVLKLFVLQSVRTNIFKRICYGETYNFGGRLLTTTGFYSDTLQTAAGCDSIVNLTLSVNRIYSTSIISSATMWYCGDDSIILRAIGQVGSTYYWYDSLTGGNLLGVGDSILVVPTQISTFYVEEHSQYGCVGPRGSRSLIYMNNINKPTVERSVVTVPCGDSARLKASGDPGAVLNWYDAHNVLVGTGTEISVFVVESSTFYVEQVLPNGCTSPRSSVMVGLNIIPRPEAVNAVTTCGVPVTLSASGMSGATFTWYDYDENGYYEIGSGETYIVDTPTISKFYYVSQTSSVGCVSMRFALWLTVNKLKKPTINDTTICSGYSVELTARGDSGAVFNWYDAQSGGNLLAVGQTYTTPTLTATQNYYVEQQSSLCSSDRAKVKVTIKPSVQTNLSENICSGTTYNFGGQILSTSGVYSDTLQSAGGCDSIVTLILTVSPSIQTNLSENICSGTTYNFGGQILNASGVYSDTLQSAHGCDSIVTLTLTVSPSVQTNLSENICSGTTYNFGGQTLSTSGVYSDILQSAGGCDSIVTLTLTVTPSLQTNLSENICSGTTYNFGGQILSTSGIYSDTLQSAGGCDSIVTLTLTITPSLQTNLSENICSGTTYNFGGQILSTSGVYSDILQSAGGCDSIVTLTLTVTPSVQTNLSENICSGTTYNFGGQILSTSGIYSDTLQSAGGCDSIVTLTLTVSPSVQTNLSENICSGTTYNFGGQILNASGVYSDTLQSAGGCDSIVTLTLTVTPSVQTNISETICSGTTYNFGGQILSTSGIYSDILQSAGGCDSIVTLTLTVTPSLQTNLSENICSGTTYNFGGQSLSTSGVYSDILQSAGGCDSIVTLTLTVTPSVQTNLSENICSGTTYNFGGQILNTSGVYSDILQSAGGCDSIVTLTLNILEHSFVSITDTICATQSYYVGTIEHTKSGIYVDTLVKSNGCDSIVTLNLTVGYFCQEQQILAATDVTYTYGDNPQLLNIYATSGLPITANITSGSSVDIWQNEAGSLNVYIMKTGTTNIHLSQAGDSIYVPAENEITVTVLPAPLILKPVDTVVNYGDIFPNLTYICYGFVYGENSSVLTTQPTLSCTTNTTNVAGNFPITLSGAEAENYTITYRDGNLEVLPAKQSLPYNAFAPYDSNINPTFGEDGYEMMIFTKNGQLIFKGIGAWDGKYKGKLMAPGVYYYVAKSPTGVVYRGSVTLLKNN